MISALGPSLGRGPGEQIDGRGRVVLPGAVDPSVCFDALEDPSQMGLLAAASGVTTLLGSKRLDSESELSAARERLADNPRVHTGWLATVHPSLIGAPWLADERLRGWALSRDALAAEEVGELLASATRPVRAVAGDAVRIGERRRLHDGTDDPADHRKIWDAQTTLDGLARLHSLASAHGARIHLLAGDLEEALVNLPEGWLVSAGLVHLALSAADVERLGVLAVTTPPVRGGRHQAALWQGLVGGKLHHVASMHRGIRLETKDQPYPHTDGGMPTLEALVPVLCDAVARGVCGWGQVASWLSDQPSQFYGLTRKGRLETGFDGDLVLVDPELVLPVDGAVSTASGWTPLEGQLSGWPVATVVAGEVVAQRGPTGVVEGSARGPRGRLL